MDWSFDKATFLLGLLILAARAADVTLGTIRTICIVHGRTWIAFFLAFVEISLWLLIISTVLDRIAESPALGFFYAFGFALGNVLGIKLEQVLAFGVMNLRIIICRDDSELADHIRKAGYAVTEFKGNGMNGPVTELFIVCRRRDLKGLLKMVDKMEPEAFYITEQAGSVSSVRRPFLPEPTGWRAVLKKK